MALLPGSPAIDAGNNALIPAGVTTDQRGLPRIVNGTVDIGAFEDQTAATTVTAVMVTASPNPSTYGQSVTFTAAVTSGTGPVTSGTVTFMEGTTVLASAVALSGSGQASFSITTLAAATHTITADYSGAGTFPASSGDVSQLVNPAPLTVTANNATKVYGAALPALSASYSGFVNGDTSAGLTTQPTLATTATASSHVAGSPYAITASGAASSNYTISYVAGSLAVNPYAFTYQIGNASQPFGSPANLAADLGTTINTGVNGENLAIAYSSTGNTTTAPAGTYPITGTLSNGTGLTSDYNVTLNPGTLTVNSPSLRSR